MARVMDIFGNEIFRNFTLPPAQHIPVVSFLNLNALQYMSSTYTFFQYPRLDEYCN